MAAIVSSIARHGLADSIHPSQPLVMRQSPHGKEQSSTDTRQQQKEEHYSGVPAPASPLRSSSTRGYRERSPYHQMATMRDRYRFGEDEGGESGGARFAARRGQDSPSSSAHDDRRGADWRFSGPSSSSGVKRSHSQRSPSRPRSQQGSQAAQIANIKEIERGESSGESRDDKGTRGVSSEYASGSRQEPSRKTPRLEQESFPRASGRDAGDSTTDWRARGAHVREESSNMPSRPQFAHSLSASGTEEASRRHQREAYDDFGPPRRHAEGPEEEAHYTWRSSERPSHIEGEARGGATGEDTSPSMSKRLPPLMTSLRGHGEPSSSSTGSQLPSGQRGRPGHIQGRSVSPPPRLPGFAAFHAHQGDSERERAYRPSDEQRRGSPPYHPEHHPHQPYAPGSDPSQQQQLVPPQQGSQQRMGYGMPSYATSPHMQGSSSMPAQSPSLSQTSHTTPGQAFIHPSLVGLPGAGGGVGSKQQPSFVSKLYSMLEDDTIEEMIAWGPSGTTFSVANPAEFAKVVLPNWFKHSNWQSFVRQLNMYGFHKVNHTYQGTPEDEIQVWEFKHPSFHRGEVHLLSDIKRKSSRHKRQDSLNRSITNAADYDMGGSPSPDLSMGHMSIHRDLLPHGMAGSAPSAYGPPPSRMPGQPSNPYSRSGYQEYPEGGTSISMQQHPQYGSASHAGGPPEMRPQQRPPPPSHANPPPAGDVVINRMDDLSDRIDAIIRHASYLESQLHTVSDQLFQTQQNEASLRSHVHHLESQMRSLRDQMYHQRQAGGLPSPMIGSGGGGNVSGQVHIPHAPSPAPSASVHGGKGSGFRETSPPPLQQQQQPQQQLQSQSMGQPQAQPGFPGRPAGGRATPTSSADAYTRFGPPRPPGMGGGGGGGATRPKAEDP